MSPQYRMLKAREVIRALTHLGFVEIRQRGSHRILQHPRGWSTAGPDHRGEDISRGLLRRILEEAHVSIEDLFHAL